MTSHAPDVDFGHVAAWTDCISAGRQLYDIADLLRAEARRWTHPAARAILEFDALMCDDWAREVTLTADVDSADRAGALLAALARLGAARLQLTLWYDRRDARDLADRRAAARPSPATPLRLLDESS